MEPGPGAILFNNQHSTINHFSSPTPVSFTHYRLFSTLSLIVIERVIAIQLGHADICFKEIAAGCR